MKITETGLEGLLVLEPTIYGDDRGYFMESFNGINFANDIHKTIFLQDNESQSSYATIRGLHYQKDKYAQAKLVRVVVGEVLDVVLDIRPNSKTYGKHFSISLTGYNKKQLFIPRGFAHGFSVLREGTIFNYKCDNLYNPEFEAGINPFDPDLKIDWLFNRNNAILSLKDKKWPNLCDIRK